MCTHCSLGPFCVNGVPLRRVNQAYVIATRTKIDISKLDIPTRLDDDYFRRSKTKPRAGGGGIFTESKQVRMSLSTEDHQNCCVCYRVIL